MAVVQMRCERLMQLELPRRIELRAGLRLTIVGKVDEAPPALAGGRLVATLSVPRTDGGEA